MKNSGRLARTWTAPTGPPIAIRASAPSVSGVVTAVAWVRKFTLALGVVACILLTGLSFAVFVM